jgi:pyruvate/2-oxoglutarate dehydrogenase complex dihydrolipoamide acyltransferase (E2) component
MKKPSIMSTRPSSAWRKKKFRFHTTARSNKPRSASGRHHRRGKGGLEIMAETISMPKLGFDMAEGLLVRWVKQVGENINKGDVLAEIETDKATVEVESSATGVVLQLIVNQGTMVPVNAPIAVVGKLVKKWMRRLCRSGKQKADVKSDEKPAPQPQGTTDSAPQALSTPQPPVSISSLLKLKQVRLQRKSPAITTSISPNSKGQVPAGV